MNLNAFRMDWNAFRNPYCLTYYKHFIMNIEDLRNLPLYSRHFDCNKPEEHTKVSIEYAISVLTGLKLRATIDFAEVNVKIKELKELIS